jgi:hypothetical protein
MNPPGLLEHERLKARDAVEPLAGGHLPRRVHGQVEPDARIPPGGEGELDERVFTGWERPFIAV